MRIIIYLEIQCQFRRAMIKNKTIHKIRLDNLLVERGLAETREKAKSLIMAGHIISNGQKLTKAGTSVPNDIPIELMSQDPFVSRGGIKLEHVIEYLGLDLSGMRILDVGASTGGFTDCLLQAGAARVYALDTGRGQLHHRLLNDKRVISIERTNIVGFKHIFENIDLGVVDVSFTSLEIVLPAVLELLSQRGQVIVLLKPQFEAKKSEVPRGGVIVDPMVHAAVIGRFLKWAVDRNIRIRNFLSSGVLGEKGNREFFFHIEPADDG